MAFEPVLNLVGDNYNCNGQILIYDVTGTFDPMSNPTGWNDNSTLYKTAVSGSPYIISSVLRVKINGVEIIASPINITEVTKTLPNLPNTAPPPLDDPDRLLYVLDNLYDDYLGGEPVEITWEITGSNNIVYTLVENTIVPIVGGLQPESCATVNNFDPKITAEVNNSCNLIIVKDVTGLYDPVTNIGGWNDTSTLYKSFALGSPYVRNATLTVKYNGVEIFGSPFSVLQSIQNSVGSQYTLFIYNPPALLNGTYEFTLTIEDNNGYTSGETYTVSQTVFVTCSTSPLPPLPPGPVPPPQSPTSYFQPELCVKTDGCKGLIVDDVTGIFNLLNNPYGWNQNITLWKTDLPTGGQPFLISAILSIKKDGVHVTGSPYNVLTTIQNSGNQEKYNLVKYMPTNFQDGVYEITLDLVSSDGSEFTVTVLKTVYCNVSDCVSKLAIDLTSDFCINCESPAFDKFQLASTLLNSLDYISRCLGEDEFKLTLTKLQRLCSQTSTGGCGCGCD